MKKLLALLLLVPLLAWGQTNTPNSLDRWFNRSYSNDVAAGLVPNVSLITVFGYAPAVGSGVSKVNVWELATAWVPMASAQSLELLSSSASDTAAGTGARSILIAGVDTNYNLISEIVTPNGTTVVALVSTYRAINSLTVLTSGTNTNNVGNITLRVASAGSTQGYIAANVGASRLGRYTVPTGYTLVLHNFFLLGNGVAGGQATVQTLTNVLLSNGTVFQGLPLTLANVMSTTITVPDGVIIAATQTVEFLINSVSIAGLDVSTGTTGYLIKNP